MKSFLLLIIAILIFSTSVFANESSPNLLLIDSSFAPVKFEKFDLDKGPCLLISESTELTVSEGKCYGEVEWNEIKNVDAVLLKGMMNTLAGVESSESSKWKEFSLAKVEEAKKIRNNYILSVHGSRASYIAFEYSNQKAVIVPMRVVTANVGNTKQAQSIQSKGNEKYPAYSPDCPLLNRPKNEMSQFKLKGKLQAYQNIIADILTKNSSIKVISISLGYKKSWIQEDNSKCASEAVEKEYQVLIDSWGNLLAKFKDRLFIVAAGNEGVSFDNTVDKKDDLWASLLAKENLLLVGSLKNNGERFPSSNYGSGVLMVKGEGIETLSPLPEILEGHKTQVRGTSFSAPIIAGIAIRVINEKPSITIKDLRVALEKLAKEVK